MDGQDIKLCPLQYVFKLAFVGPHISYPDIKASSHQMGPYFDNK